jgi:dephospho-CoA kinase
VLNSSRQVDRKALAAIVFNDKQKLEALNNLVHPMVEKDFFTWCEHHNNFPYVLHEAAILFESGFDRFFDASILVVAPLETCIRRVINRDSVARENVLERIENQWPQEKKLLLAQYVVTNDETTLVIPQVLRIHQQILGS